MFILDFDDTLFDTAKFDAQRAKAVQDIGVTEELFYKTKEIAETNEQGLGNYSDIRHAEVLSDFGYSKDIVFYLLRDVTKKLPSFLLSNTLDFLRLIRHFGKSMILLTWGNPQFQELKVRGSGIAHFFDAMYFVNDSKSYMVKKIVDDRDPQTVWFINDKVKETLEVIRKVPVNIILRKSPRISEEEYIVSDLPYFENLMDIYTYIDQYLHPYEFKVMPMGI